MLSGIRHARYLAPSFAANPDCRLVAVVEKGWLPRYAARRIIWHVLDHAWEIEGRSERPSPSN